MLFCADADDGEHAAGEAVLGAVGEVAVGLAAGAVADEVNGFGAETGVEKLTAVGLKEGKGAAWTDGAVSGLGGRGKGQVGFFG